MPINQNAECSKQQEQMQIDYIYDPWEDQKIRQLFLPSEGEHPMDAIARRIDLLMEARTSPEGYKMVVEGDTHGNCTGLDKIKILDKCLYLISALSIALNGYPKKNWTTCCEEASKTCSILTTPYTE